MLYLKAFTTLALTFGVATPSFAQVGKTFGKRAAPESSKACERPKFFAKLNLLNLTHVDRDVAYWSVLEIKAEVGATIPASSVLSNVAYRGDRLDAIRNEISELGAFRSSTIDYDDAEYFAVDPISGTLSWKKLPPRKIRFRARRQGVRRGTARTVRRNFGYFCDFY